MNSTGTHPAHTTEAHPRTGPPGRPATGRPAAGRARRRARRHGALAGAALATALLTASCGYGNQASSGDGNVRPVGGSSEVGPGAGPDSGYGSGYGDGAGSGDADETGKDARTGPAKTLTLQNSPELGQVVTDSQGWTLYRFDKDSAGPPASACNDACAEAWPPVPAEDVSASAGIKSGRLGRVAREDGSWQLTLGGRPVYRFAKDTAPGDTKGHGVDGTWNALAPDGGKAGRQSAPETSDAAQLRAVQDGSLGTILADGKGRTLYRFDRDSAWPMKSNCTGSCLDTWKPAKPVDEDRLSGVARKLVSTYERPDGTKQLAVDCWPVYWFTGDKNPGDTEGQGKQGLWFAVTDKGGKAGS